MSSQWIMVGSIKDVPVGDWQVWIPEDRRPIKTAYVSENGIAIVGDSFAFDRNPVKAYMPLPEPPEANHENTL